MTFGHLFASTFSAPAAATAAVLFLAGCGTPGMVNAMAPVAQPAALPQPGSTTFAPTNTQEAAQAAGQRNAQVRRDAIAPSTTVQNSGAFPNLNIRPTAANTQLTPEQSAALLANLRSTQGRLSATNAAAARSMPNADELRRIGASHGDSTLQAISAESAQ